MAHDFEYLSAVKLWEALFAKLSESLKPVGRLALGSDISKGLWGLPHY
jgi:hypothetical protein